LFDREAYFVVKNNYNKSYQFLFIFFYIITYIYIVISYCIDNCQNYILYAKHYIIGNSTFSWFGAYLSSSNEPVVCYPETWFRDQIHDKGLDNWIKIEDK
jgi:hypothetical protein